MLNDLKSQLGQSMQTMRSFLERPVRVQRGGVGLGVPPASARLQAREEEIALARRMQDDLHGLLQTHPSARQLMKHLALVEFTLRYKGLRAMQALPVRVLARALAQLEKLVWDWSRPGLADLRSRLAVIVKTQPAMAASGDTGGTGGAAPAGFAAESDMDHGASGEATELTEVDRAAFEEMERSWAGQMPAPAQRTAAAAGG